MGELASYTYLDLSDRIDPVLGELGGSLVLLSFPLAFVLSAVLFRKEALRKQDRNFDEHMRKLQAELNTRLVREPERAVLEGRIRELQRIADSIGSSWPGVEFASNTEAESVLSRSTYVGDRASELMQEAYGRDDDLLERLGMIRVSVSRYEREAQTVLAAQK